jgi:HSP20 family protein
MLDDFLACKSPMRMLKRPVWHPATDVFETEQHVVIRMEIAGMNDKEIEVTFYPESSTMKISGRRVDGYGEPKIGFSQMEIIYGAFEREILLPRGVDGNGITRSYTNGLLEILVPKIRAARTRKVPIKVEE